MGRTLRYMHTSLGKRFVNLLPTAWAMPPIYHLMVLLLVVGVASCGDIRLAFAGWHPGAVLVRLRRPARALWRKFHAKLYEVDETSTKALGPKLLMIGPGGR